MVKRPIDSFVQYFLDVKPYHTKILEIVEQYLFSDFIDVNVGESTFLNETWANNPLCTQVGYGLDFDDEHGFSAQDGCSDVFDCVGGYGLVYDNSDLLVSAPVISYNNAESSLSISGDYRYDAHYQISSISGNNTIRIVGDHTTQIAPHSLFVIIPRLTLPVLEVTADGFRVSGNMVEHFTTISEFSVIGSLGNDGLYSVNEAIYDDDNNQTVVKVDLPSSLNQGALALGSILIKSFTKNNGVYQRNDVYREGTPGNYTTVIILHPDTPLKLPLESAHGTIVLRTSMSVGRRIWLNDGGLDPNTMFDTRILDVGYDIDTNITTVSIDRASNTLDAEYGINGIESLDLRGYFGGAGFDGFGECSAPSQHNLSVVISEFLQIQSVNFVTPTPTPIPSPTPTPTPIPSEFLFGFSFGETAVNLDYIENA